MALASVALTWDLRTAAARRRVRVARLRAGTLDVRPGLRPCCWVPDAAESSAQSVRRTRAVRAAKCGKQRAGGVHTPSRAGRTATAFCACGGQARAQRPRVRKLLSRFTAVATAAFEDFIGVAWTPRASRALETLRGLAPPSVWDPQPPGTPGAPRTRRGVGTPRAALVLSHRLPASALSPVVPLTWEEFRQVCDEDAASLDSRS